MKLVSSRFHLAIMTRGRDMNAGGRLFRVTSFILLTTSCRSKPVAIIARQNVAREQLMKRDRDSRKERKKVLTTQQKLPTSQREFLRKSGEKTRVSYERISALSRCRQPTKIPRLVFLMSGTITRSFFLKDSYETKIYVPKCSGPYAS